MIEVRLYANLSRATSRDAALFQVEARAGVTVKDVMLEAGISLEDVYIIMINGQAAGPDDSLADGDRLALFPAISGG